MKDEHLASYLGVNTKKGTLVSRDLSAWDFSQVNFKSNLSSGCIRFVNALSLLAAFWFESRHVTQKQIDWRHQKDTLYFV